MVKDFIMIQTALMMILFGVAYAVKGGQTDDVLRNWAKIKKRNNILNFIMGDKLVSTVIVFVGMCLATAVNSASVIPNTPAWLGVVIFCAVWRFVIAPNPKFTELLAGNYGKAFVDLLMRGGLIGICFFAATGHVDYIYGSFSYIFCAILGFKGGEYIGIPNRWGWVEFLIGAFVIGLPTGTYLEGF